MYHRPLKLEQNTLILSRQISFIKSKLAIQLTPLRLNALVAKCT